SPTEICDIYLVPYDNVNPTKYTDWMGGGPPYKEADNSMADSWYGSDFGAVGDNVRERPYADIYPRLTTKSNTFTVYYTVQVLKNPAWSRTQWNESTGSVMGTYPGSTSLERYLDPNDPNIPDYGDGSDPTGKPPIDTYYKWRVIANSAFPP